jgi:hypothetical protein
MDRGKILMKLNETTHHLYAAVSSWRYACDLQGPTKTGDKAEVRLHLDGVVNECSVLLEGLPLGLCIVCNAAEVDSIPLLSPWRLDLIPASDGELLMPKALEAVLTVPETTLWDLKDCLLFTTNLSNCSVVVQLAVQENLGRSSGNDVAERSFSIVEFGYVLEHERKNI